MAINNQVADKNKISEDISIPETYKPPMVLKQSPERPQRKANLVIAIIFLIIVFSAVGFGAVLASRIYDPAWNPFRPSPEKVIRDMVLNMENVKSLLSKLEFAVNTNVPTQNQFKMSFSGSSDLNSLENVKGDFVLDVSARDGSGEAFAFKIGFRVLGKDMYIRLVDFNPAFSQTVASVTSFDLNTIKGTWIKLPEQKIFEIESKNEISPATIQKIITASNMYSVKAQLPDVDGKYNYIVKIENDKLTSFIDAILREVLNQAKATGQTLPENADLMVSAAKGIISDFLNKVGEIDIQFLIGKKDNLLYNLNVEKSVDLNEILGINNGVVSFKMNIENSNFNEKTEILPPSQFREFDSAFPEVKNFIIKNNIDGIRLDEAAIKKATGSYLITGDDVQPFKTIIDDVKTYTGIDIVSYQSKYSYCAYARLVGDVEKYYCVSTNGLGRETTKNPGMTGYCTGKTYICPK